MDWDYERGDDYYSDFYGKERQETEFSQEVDRPFTHKGVKYVFCENVTMDSDFYRLYRQLQRTKQARIKFRMRAYAMDAEGPEDAMPDSVAVFVAVQDLPFVREEVRKII